MPPPAVPTTPCATTATPSAPNVSQLGISPRRQSLIAAAALVRRASTMKERCMDGSRRAGCRAHANAVVLRHQRGVNAAHGLALRVDLRFDLTPEELDAAVYDERNHADEQQVFECVGAAGVSNESPNAVHGSLLVFAWFRSKRMVTE